MDPAKYFHGWKQIIDTFNSTLRFYGANKRGTTFLIQGAPGAGKTVLLDILAHQAMPKGWAVAKIGMKDLFSPASMAQSLAKSYTIDSEYALKRWIKFIECGIVESVAGHASPREILRYLAPETGLILVLNPSSSNVVIFFPYTSPVPIFREFFFEANDHLNDRSNRP